MSRRRFYKVAAATPDGGVALDGRSIKTPGKNPLRVPTVALAQAIATEWQEQGQTIKPESMILTKLANTAIDRMAPNRTHMIAEVVHYANSDMVCYRADRPPDLVASQKAHWDPVVEWAKDRLGADFKTVAGVVHVDQASETLEAMRRHFEARDSFVLTAIHNMMTLTGSALIAAMVEEGALPPAAAWEASHVDEDHQIAHWGWDSEAKVRRSLRQGEFLVCVHMLRLLGKATITETGS